MSSGVPDGVERWTPAAPADPKQKGYICIPDPAGEYIHISDLDKVRAQGAEEEQERLQKLLPPLLDDHTANVIRHVEGVPGAGNDRARSQVKVLAALDQQPEKGGSDV